MLEKRGGEKNSSDSGFQPIPYILPKLGFTRYYFRDQFVYLVKTEYLKGKTFTKAEWHVICVTYIFLLLVGIAILSLKNVESENGRAKYFQGKLILQKLSDWLLALTKRFWGNKRLAQFSPLEGETFHGSYLPCRGGYSHCQRLTSTLTSEALTPVRVATIQSLEELLQNSEWKIRIISKKDWWEGSLNGTKFQQAFPRFEYLTSQGDCVSWVLERERFACFISQEVLLLLMSEGKACLQEF